MKTHFDFCPQPNDYPTSPEDVEILAKKAIAEFLNESNTGASVVAMHNHLMKLVTSASALMASTVGVPRTKDMLGEVSGFIASNRHLYSPCISFFCGAVSECQTLLETGSAEASDQVCEVLGGCCWVLVYLKGFDSGYAQIFETRRRVGHPSAVSKSEAVAKLRAAIKSHFGDESFASEEKVCEHAACVMEAAMMFVLAESEDKLNSTLATIVTDLAVPPEGGADGTGKVLH